MRVSCGLASSLPNIDREKAIGRNVMQLVEDGSAQTDLRTGHFTRLQDARRF